jgi:hypothetical protein
MKIAPLLITSASALETSTSASSLLAAVGKRNVTHMESLIQSLAEESISEPGWKFDKDIQDALTAIRNMFVTSIQNAIVDQHIIDQESHNCQMDACFGDCQSQFDQGTGQCQEEVKHCEDYGRTHKECRKHVYGLYIDMANKCGKLACFDPPVIKCPTESCICPDGLSAGCCDGAGEDFGDFLAGHRSLDSKDEKRGIAEWKRINQWVAGGLASDEGVLDQDGRKINFDDPHYYDVTHDKLADDYKHGSSKNYHKLDHLNLGECKSDPKHGYGAWLQATAQTYKSAYGQWVVLHQECRDSYRLFLTEDVKCDGIQREFEKCMCSTDVWKETLCDHTYKSCNDLCWSTYTEQVPNLQCQEKDRKIDWSATKKIECYLDVLLHDYTKKELIDNCGSEDCVNVAREKSYKDCASICPNVDHQGEWKFPTCSDDGVVTFGDAHASRKEHHSRYNQFIGDGKCPDGPDGQRSYKCSSKDKVSFKCDANGAHVHTDHRGVHDRANEHRCTEHLDIDFQVPNPKPCPGCNPEKEMCEVCDDAFHCLYYEEFDQTAKICSSQIQKCDDKFCEPFPEVKLTSCIAPACDEKGINCDASDYDNWMPQATRLDRRLAHDGGIQVGEYTHAWAYNRCECKKCVGTTGGTGVEMHPWRQCMGPESLAPKDGRNKENDSHESWNPVISRRCNPLNKVACLRLAALDECVWTESDNMCEAKMIK